MVRSLLFQAQDILPSSSEICPIFVHLLTQDPSGVFDCNPPPFKFKKPFGDHLLGQTTQNTRLLIPGAQSSAGQNPSIFGPQSLGHSL